MNTTNTSSERLSRVLFIILIALIFGFTFTSCTVDKRLYRPGFHIERLDKRSTPVEKEKIVEIKKKDAPQIKNVELTAHVEPSIETHVSVTTKPTSSLVKQNKPVRHKMNSSVSTFISYKKEADKEVDGEKQDVQLPKKKRVHPLLWVSLLTTVFPLPTGIGLLLFLLFLIPGLIITRRNPDKYSSKIFLRTLLITFLVLTIAGVVFLTVIGAWGGLGMSGC